ncbi:MAG TPA: O-antigen ligase family protein [Longimicrobium sp.]|nr:O-antigen ligase family protein [Longimicrobium sp.]
MSAGPAALPAGAFASSRRASLAAATAEAEPRWTIFHTTLAVLLLTYVWRLQDLFPVLQAVKLVPLASLAAIALFLVMDGGARLGAVSRTPLFRLAGALLLLMVLSVPGSVFPGNSFRFIYQDHVKTFLLTVLLMAGVSSTRQVERLAAVQVAGAVIYTVFVLTHFDPSGGRLQGLVFYDSNDLGMLLVCALPFAVLFLRPGRPVVVRLMAAAAIGVCVLGIVRSGSRGGLLGLAAVALYMLFRFTAFRRGARIGALVGGLALLLVIGNAQYWEMMETLLHPTTDYNWSGNSSEGRMEVWKRGVGYMADRPVLGVGVSGFYVAEGTLSPRARFQQYGRGMKWSAPHNSFVQVGAELGVTGLVLFLLLLRAGFRAARPPGLASRDGARASPDLALGQALAASLLGYVVTGFFLSQAYAAFLYTLLGMIGAYARDEAPAPAPLPARPLGRGGGWNRPPVPGALPTLSTQHSGPST